MSGAQYSHPVNSDIPLIITYPATGIHEGYAVLHADQCNHQHRRATREPLTFQGEQYYYADDYFVVSPCAKLKKSVK